VARHPAAQSAGGLFIDVVRVGDATELPLGSEDANILRWAEREERILITEDRHTMPSHLAQHLQLGHRSPGVFIVTLGCSIAQMIACLELVAHAGEPGNYENVMRYMP
jgi:hypothetical protein